MSKLSEHFDSKEFACHCGCGESKVNPKLIELLESIRKKVGKSINIVSGHRCEEHNKKVGGAAHSQHVLGNAADIRIPGMDASDVQHWLVINFNKEIGGMGCYNTFTHVDVREGYARWNG
jgi:uncharacterized protein YcbK (DUF882 family)